MMKTLSLHEYNIHIGSIRKNDIHELIDQGDVSQYFILVDEQTRKLCLPLFLEKT